MFLKWFTYIQLINKYFMKNRKIIISVVSLLFLVTITIVSFRILDEGKKNRLLLEVISSTMKQHHFEEIQIDNEFSKKIHKIFIERLDYTKRFFLQDDIDKLNQYLTTIDDDINFGNFTFFETAAELYETRSAEVEEYYKGVLEKPFDFTINEDFVFDSEKRDFAKNKKELKNYWYQYAKYQTMTKLASSIKIQEEATAKNDTSVKVQTYEELESKARKEVLENLQDWTTRMKMRDRKDLLNMYFSTISSCFDPHSDYLAPKEKEDFDIQMAGQLEGIGATLSQPNDYIKVVQIVDGSPCWKQGDLKVNDLILKVAQGNGEPVNVVGMKMDDAIRLIRGKKGTEVRLTVKKVDGTIKEIPIIRDVIVMEETFAKSAVISDKIDNTKVGYIYLPRFYADFNDKNGRFCSKDVEVELKKMKLEKIDKLVIDLRNNGGGSLQDVVEIVGMFIEKGPVVQVKGRVGAPMVLRDDNSKISFDGKLVIMINEFSASASEILAAAIQDYGRGVIVGSKHSHGKGTVQRFVPIDEVIQGYNNLKPFGSLKLTIQKFYRINGGSTQLKGVSSDIIIPDAYSELEVGEKELDYPLKWDEIPNADYKIINSVSNLKELKANSEKRIREDSAFVEIQNYAKWLKDTQEEHVVSLNLKKYMETEKLRDEKSKKFSDLSEKETNLIFTVPKADSIDVYSDTIKTRRVETWYKELKKDIHLKEVYKIVNEMK